VVLEALVALVGKAAVKEELVAKVALD